MSGRRAKALRRWAAGRGYAGVPLTIGEGHHNSTPGSVRRWLRRWLRRLDRPQLGHRRPGSTTGEDMRTVMKRRSVVWASLFGAFL